MEHSLVVHLHVGAFCWAVIIAQVGIYKFVLFFLRFPLTMSFIVHNTHTVVVSPSHWHILDQLLQTNIDATVKIYI